MCRAPQSAPARSQDSPDLADIFRRCGADYRRRYQPNAAQRRVMAAIEACRTPALGGHVAACNRCGGRVHHYHSCCNRHCPKCQTLAKERWIEARQSDILAVPHFHLVFTLPHGLNPLLQGNPRPLYSVLFKAAADTLLRFGRDPHWIGGEIGITLVLHSWGQTLGQHVHVHGLVTAGGLADDGSWKPARQRFLFPVKALSKVFRGAYLDGLARLRRRGEIDFAGTTAPLADDQGFQRFLAVLRRRDWVVYAKRPLAGPQQVLGYLGRYTHRVALSNDRLLALEDGKVAFHWRDYRDGSKRKVMHLEAHEFIRRFLLHVLPRGFMRIRHYGLFANRHRSEKLAQCRRQLGQDKPEPREEESLEDVMRRLTGRDIHACPVCGKGRLHIVETLKPRPRPSAYPTGPP